MGESRSQSLEHVEAQLFICLLNLTLLQFFRENRTLFESETVGGDVRHVEGDGLLDVVHPTRHRLVGQPVDKVDADVAEAFLLSVAHRFDRLLCRVSSVDRLQLLVVKTLDADAESVEGQPRQTLQIPFRQIFRISFDGNLYRFAIIYLIYIVQNNLQFLNGELRWRTPTEVDGSDRLTFQILLSQRQFFADGVNQLRSVPLVGGRVEIAVVAAAGAEGNVGVEGGHNVNFVFIKTIAKEAQTPIT